MPCFAAEIVPLFLIAPKKVETCNRAMPVPAVVTILLLLSTLMPPRIAAGVENSAAAQEGAADDRDAARPDRARIGDATAEGGVADHHRGGVAAKDGRIRPFECHASPRHTLPGLVIGTVPPTPRPADISLVEPPGLV